MHFIGATMHNFTLKNTCIIFIFLLFCSSSTAYANKNLANIMSDISDLHSEIGDQVYESEFNEDSFELSIQLNETILLALNEVPSSIEKIENPDKKSKKLKNYQEKINSLSKRCLLMSESFKNHKNLKAKYHHFMMTVIMIGGHISFR
jgi:hypothetical protein